MNILYMTQSGTLNVFHKIHTDLASRQLVNKGGFYLTDSVNFEEFIYSQPSWLPEVSLILKEWEIVEKAMSHTLDLASLRLDEQRLGSPFLWDALIADRRITFGPLFTVAQSYTSKFSHQEMLCILQVAINKLETLFDKLAPELVVSYQCLTIGDFLAFLISKRRKISFVNLRPTKMGNFILGTNDIFEPALSVKKAYLDFLQAGIDPSLQAKVDRYITDATGNETMYEGVISPSAKPPTSVRRMSTSTNRFFGTFAKGVCRTLILELKYRTSNLRFDNSHRGFIIPLIFSLLIRPYRARRALHLCARSSVDPTVSGQYRYAFFPLHPEPEVSLLVYSKTLRNQIEAIRVIAASLPIDMKLVVKEHPWQIGRRKIGFYAKLLAIPNVVVAPPDASSGALVKGAQLITVIAGSIGFEGLLRKKPVVVLGGAPFNFLPNTMLRHVPNLNELPVAINELLEGYKFEQFPIDCYVAAILTESVSVDFYSNLLGRTGVYIPNGRSGVDDVRKLSDYILSRHQLAEKSGRPR